MTPATLLKSPLDSSLLSLDDAQLAFFREQTGIYDVEKLKQHICDIQQKAYQHFPYPCIRRLQIARLPSYEHVLWIGKTFERPIFLDVGCCFGHDLRALVASGYPHEWVLGVDLKRDLWELGTELFRAAEKERPISFIEGDIFDDDFLDPSPKVQNIPKLFDVLPLKNLKSLTMLRGQASAIHTSMLFHLFPESDQLRMAKKLATLLSPVPGSIIFGNHIGLEESGIHTRNASGIRMFCHSPQTWCEMWDGDVFPKGVVEVEAKLVSAGEAQPSQSLKENTNGFYGNDSDDRWKNIMWLVWSVKRI
ncbi:hypothetical protein Clacol_002390 [Clathrus columnatus]|uniref:Methyltransferase domain-containing protein n=1 Tax=Clathrus columnatus TaxID=1419009 RepID=A0AAV5A3I2_9AGAM|nr:hypothetical protein Clacol_002390 [Clathrus columnatus]